MRKECKKIIGAIIVGMGLLLAIPAGATDYQSYSLEELDAMRGTMSTAGAEERDAFQNARQKKMQALNPEERSSYQLNNRKGSDNSNGKGIRARDGSGLGSMKRYGGSSAGGGSMGSRQGRGGKR